MSRSGAERPATTARPPNDPLVGVRGVAAVTVALYHLSPAHLVGGWVSVDVFLVLSGYAITARLLPPPSEASTDAADLGAFWRGRLARLGPTVLAVAGVMLAVAALRDEGLGTLLEQTLSAPLGMSNWAELARGWPTTPLSPLWSLAVEIQCYVIWALAMTQLRSTRARRRFTTAALISSIAVAAATMGAPWARRYLGTDLRLSPFAAGSLVFLWRNHLAAAVARLRAWAELGVAVGLAVWWSAMTTVRQSGAANRYFPVGQVTLTAAVVVVAAVLTARPRGATGSVLGAPPLRWLGEISFPLYLVSYGIGRELPHLVADGPGGRLLALSVCLGAAAILHRCIERPARAAINGRGAAARSIVVRPAGTQRPASIDTS